MNGCRRNLKVRIMILEYTRCNDYRLDWRKTAAYYKSERYRPLRDKMADSLPHGWTVCLTIRICGSESQWSASLLARGIQSNGHRRTYLLDRIE